MSSSSRGNGGRFLLALGGLGGFSCAFFGAMTAGSDISNALIRGSIGMVIGAFMMKGMLHVIYGTIREARREKIKAAAKARQEAAQEEAQNEPATAETR